MKLFLRIISSILLVCFTLGNVNTSFAQDFITQTSASLNLEGEERKVNRDKSISISASYSNNCMNAFSSVTPDCQIDGIAVSNECGLVNHATSTTSYFTRYSISGNNNVKIPLEFNFELTGNIKQVSLGNRGCLGISSAAVSFSSYTDKSETKSSTQLIYQNGILVISNYLNFNSEDSYAILTPIVYAKGTNKIYDMGLDVVSDFLTFLKSVPESDKKNISNSIKALENIRIPSISLEGQSQVLSKEQGELLALLNVFGIREKIPLGPIPIDVELGLGYRVQQHLNLNRTVSAETSANGFVNVFLHLDASTSPCGGSYSEVNFSGQGSNIPQSDSTGTLKLASITVPQNFSHPEVDLSKVKVLIGNREFPVKEPILASEPTIIDEIPIVSPNPASGDLTITMNTQTPITAYAIIDISGKKVQSNVFVRAHSNHLVIPVNTNIANGTYAVQIQLNDRMITKKVSILR